LADIRENEKKEYPKKIIMKKILKTCFKILLILILIISISIPFYFNYWRNSKTLKTFNVFSEPTEITYSEIIWKNDSVANMLVEKAFFFVPVKIDGIKEKLYMQFDTGIPATFFHGITLNKLLENNKSIKTEYSKDSIQFFKNPILNIGKMKFKADKIEMLNRGSEKIDSSFIIIGNIGLDAIVGRTLILDFKKNKIAITEKNINHLGKSFEFIENASVDKYPLLIPAKIGEENTRLFFDTGSSMFSLLTSEKQLSKLKSKKKLEKLCCLSSGGKEYEFYRKQIIENIQIGKNIKKEEFVYGFFKLNFIDYLPKSIIYGITGNKMFDNEIIVIDNKNNVLGIEK
jgi:hypothetical protein